MVGGFCGLRKLCRKDDSGPALLVRGCCLCGLGAGVGEGYATECAVEHVCRSMTSKTGFQYRLLFDVIVTCRPGGIRAGSGVQFFFRAARNGRSSRPRPRMVTEISPRLLSGTVPPGARPRRPSDLILMG